MHSVEYGQVRFFVTTDVPLYRAGIKAFLEELERGYLDLNPKEISQVPDRIAIADDSARTRGNKSGRKKPRLTGMMVYANHGQFQRGNIELSTVIRAIGYEGGDMPAEVLRGGSAAGLVPVVRS